ncbi:MAG: ABC transporter permease, partial [Bacteroidota bacterium]
MVRHYFTIAWRNLTRNKFFSVINIIGFAIGITCSLLLCAYSWQELHYDEFHEKKDRIFLVGVQSKDSEEEWEGGWTTPPLGPALQEYFAEIEDFTRICFWFDEVLVTYDENKYIEKGIIGADSSIFNLFTIPFIVGNPETALSQPNSIVITQSAAKKYFGKQDPMGKTLQFNHFFNECIVTGVVEDYPDDSHLDFEILLSLSSLNTINFNFETSWQNHTFSTYVLLKERVQAQQVALRFQDFLKDRYEPYLVRTYQKTYEEMYQNGDYYRLFFKPLEEVYLSNLIFENEEGKKSQLYILFVVGIAILLLAGINYVNLSTALSTNRAKEIGIRKTLGSQRSSLIKQFILESVLITITGLIMGIFLLEMSIPYFNELTGKNLHFDISNPLQLLALSLFALVIGVLGGLYPALVISSFKPISIFGYSKQTKSGKAIFRNTLVVFQFAICIIMIISTLLVHKQLNFMQNKSLGFDTEQVLIVKRPSLLNKNQEAFKLKLLKRPDVKSVSFTNTIPGRHFDGHGQHFLGDPANLVPTIHPLIADNGLLEALNLKVVQGEKFDPAHPDRKVALINQAAVEQLQLDNPLSLVLDNHTMGKEPYNIIGVVKDFHFNSFHHQVEPLVIFPLNDLQDHRFGYILIKMQSSSLQETLETVKTQWQNLSNHSPFDYTFLDEDFNRLFENERVTAKV